MARLISTSLLTLAVLYSFSTTTIAAPKVGQSAQVFKTKLDGKDVKRDYLLYLPKTYLQEKAKKWPVLIFLHGSGERGSDVNRVKIHGPPKQAAAGKDLPFIVVSPQCPKGVWWNPEVQIALLDDIIKTYSVDANRIYLTGLSMGGYGTWTICCKYPNRFAAAVPICGGGNPKVAAKMKALPTWVFHGDKDKAVPLKKSQDMVAAIKKAGGNVKLTVYPGVGHDSWTQSYDNPALYKWLLSQSRSANQKSGEKP